MMKKFKSGFTLIELLVVIAIIGIIASIALISLEESRQKSRNASRVTQIKEYQKAFNLYFSDTGHYPMFGSGETATMCLGDYSDNSCWNNGTGILERSAVADAITPHYMGRIPDGESIMFGEGNSTLYEGMIYTHQDFGKQYTIRYFMQGNDRSCILDGASATNVGSDTLCTLVVQ